MDETYACDPNKNKLCKKSECYINGGACHRTIYKEFELKEVTTNNK